MKRLDYIDLFTKKVLGSISSKEKELLDNLSKDPKSQKDIESIQNIWDASASYSPKVSFNSTKAFKKFKENNLATAESANVSSKSIYSKFFQAALALSFIALAIYFTFNYFIGNSNERSIDHYTIEGTEVWLNSNANVKPLKSKSGEKVLKIDGFVYLDNTESTQLTIEENNHNIVLQNTKASVYIGDDNELEMSIEEGFANVKSNNKTYVIESGETIKINKLGQVELGIVNSNNIFTWRLNTLQFNNTPMDVVIRDLERYFDITIDSKVSGLEECFFTSPILTDTELKTVFEILKTSHKADVIPLENHSNHFELVSINCL